MPPVVRLCVKLYSFGITGLYVQNQGLDRSLCLLQLHAPNATSEYQAFVDEVNVPRSFRVSPREFTVLTEILTHMTDTDTWKGVIEKDGLIRLNENGRYLLHLCCTNGLCFLNTFFRHREVHKYMVWYRPNLDQKSLIDFCIVLSDLFSDLLDVRVKRGAELATDHYLEVCSF